MRSISYQPCPPFPLVFLFCSSIALLPLWPRELAPPLLPQPLLLPWHLPPPFRCGLAVEHAELKCPRPLQQWQSVVNIPGPGVEGRSARRHHTSCTCRRSLFVCLWPRLCPWGRDLACPLRRVSQELQVQLGGHGSGPNSSGPYGVVICLTSEVERFVRKHKLRAARRNSIVQINKA